MEDINNTDITNQILGNQIDTPISKSINIFKYLFFISIFILLVIITIFCYLLNNKFSNLPSSVFTNTPNQNTVSTPAQDSQTKDWVNWAAPWPFTVKFPKTWDIDAPSKVDNMISIKVPEIAGCDYNIIYYKNFDDFQKLFSKSIKFSSLSEFMDSRSDNSVDFHFINKTTSQYKTVYKTNSIDTGYLSYFIENNQDKSFCEVDLCGEGTPSDDLFISSFNFY